MKPEDPFNKKENIARWFHDVSGHLLEVDGNSKTKQGDYLDIVELGLGQYFSYPWISLEDMERDGGPKHPVKSVNIVFKMLKYERIHALEFRDPWYVRQVSEGYRTFQEWAGKVVHPRETYLFN